MRKIVLSFTVISLFLLVSVRIGLAAPPGWGNDIRLTFDSAQSLFLSIVNDQQANVHIVWQDARYGNDEILYTKLDNNGNIVIYDTRLTFNSGYSWKPAIAIDKLNYLHVVWEDWRTGNAEIYYTKLDNSGNTVIEDTQISSSGAYAYRPNISVDSSGNIHITWWDNRDNGWFEIYYTKLNNNGQTIVDDKRITFDSAFSYNPDSIVDKYGNVHIVWEDGRDYGQNFEIYYKKLDNNGTALTPDIRLTFDGYSSQKPDITTDVNGNMHIAWADSRDNNLYTEVYYTKLDNNGTTLVDDLRITVATGWSYIPDIAMDSKNNIHIVWEDDRDYTSSLDEIYYTKMDNNANVLIDDLRLTFDQNASFVPVLAIDKQDNIHVAWHDNRDFPGTYNYEIYYKRSSIITPVLLVHGYLSDPTIWSYIESQLQNDGYVVFKSDYAPGSCSFITPSGCANGDIKTYGWNFASEINFVEQQTGASQVDIIAHSMGGLIARWYIQTLGGYPHVRRLIELGTPNSGSELTYLRNISLLKLVFSIINFGVGPGIAAQQMTPGSSFLNAIASLPFPGSTQYYTVPGTVGFSPPLKITSSVLPGADDGVVATYSAHFSKANGPYQYSLNHFNLYQDNSVYQQIKTILQSPQPPSGFAQTSSNTPDAESLPLITNTANPGQINVHAQSFFASQEARILLDGTSGQLIFSLKTPSGTIIDPSTSDPNITYATTTAGAYYGILNPEAGVWEFYVDGANIATPEPYTIITFLDSSLSLDAALDNTTLTPGQSVLISGTLLANGAPFIGQAVSASVTKPDLTQSTMILYDDGLHGDGAANDGVYADYFTDTAQSGGYAVTVTASGTFGADPYTIQDIDQFSANFLPDLMISANDITFSNPAPQPGELVTITANIHNIGLGNAPNAVIDFYDGDPVLGGALIGQQTVTVAPGQTVNVSVSWTALKGSHKIFVMPDPTNSFFDANYLNEKEFKKIVVCSGNTGNTSGTFSGGTWQAKGKCVE